ncbi:MAG: ribosome maturation factor RimP [Bacilli bacterium]
MNENIEQRITELVTPVAEELNIEIADVEFVQEGADWFLRISIDTPNGVDLELCCIANERMSEAIDANDPIPHLYYLDVASPGAERPLKKEADFENAVGKKVFVQLHEAVNDMNEFEGKLLSYLNEELTIEVTIKTRKKKFVTQRQNIVKARLAVSFA